SQFPGVLGPGAAPSRRRQALERTYVGFWKLPLARGLDHEADIARARHPLPAPPRQVYERRRLTGAEPHRQGAAQIELGVDSLVGVDGGEVARGQAPEYAIGGAARRGRGRADAVAVAHEPPARQGSNAERGRARAARAHQRAAHVRAIGEVERHGGTRAEERVPSQIEKPSAITNGSRISTAITIAR